MKGSTTSDRWIWHRVSGVGFIYLCSIPLALLVGIALARLLGPEEYGRYAFLMSAVAIISMPLASGLPQLATRETARYKYEKSWGLLNGLKRAGLIWVLAFSAMMLGLGYVYITLIAPEEFREDWSVLKLFLLLAPINGIVTLYGGIAKGLGRPVVSELPTKVLTQLFMLAGLYGLLLSGTATLQTVVSVQLAINVAILVIVALMSSRITPADSIGIAPVYSLNLWLVSMGPLFLIGAVGTMNAQVITLLLGLMGSDASVAALRVADRACQFVAIPLTLINVVMAPLAVKLNKSNDRNKMQRDFQRAARGAFAVSLVIAVILVAFGRPIISLLFGNEYVDRAYFPLVIISCSQLINVGAGSVGTLLVMCGEERHALFAQISALLVSAVLAVLTIPLLEEIGAAFSAGVGLLVWNMLMTVFVRKKLGIKAGII